MFDKREYHTQNINSPYLIYTFSLLLSLISTITTSLITDVTFVRRETPRELRNKAEKQRRDKLNESVARLAAIVPPVVKSGRKINKRSVLRLAAHYLRSHQHGVLFYYIYIKRYPVLQIIKSVNFK